MILSHVLSLHQDLTYDLLQLFTLRLSLFLGSSLQDLLQTYLTLYYVDMYCWVSGCCGGNCTLTLDKFLIRVCPYERMYSLFPVDPEIPYIVLLNSYPNSMMTNTFQPGLSCPRFFHISTIYGLSFLKTWYNLFQFEFLLLLLLWVDRLFSPTTWCIVSF